jgi:hypothetical protein
MLAQAREQTQNELTAGALSFAGQLISILTAQSYLPLYDESLLVCQNRIRAKRKWVCAWIFSLINLSAIWCDRDRISIDYSGDVLVGLVARIIFFQVISNYHVLISFVEKPRGRLFRFIACIVIVAFCGNVTGILGVKYGMKQVRISEIPPVNPFAFAISRNLTSSFEICSASYEGLSLVELVGRVLGPYDLEENLQVFDLQMQYFFGPNWTDTFECSVFHIDDADRFIAYGQKADDIVIFGFRGFASRVETVLHTRVVAEQFILPFCHWDSSPV